MEKDTLVDKVIVIGLVLILLATFSILFIKIYKIEKELIQAKKLAVEYHENAELAYGMVQSLNEELDSIDNKHKLDKLLKDLSQS